LDKYFPNTTVINWFRLASHKQLSVSRIWTSLIRSIHVITHWLSWRPGTGHIISIGRDQILGLGDISILSDAIITHLRHKRIIVLAQATVSRDPVTLSENWLSNEELGLACTLATAWDLYCKSLIGVGVSLHDTNDTLLWTPGTHHKHFS
jgi:hypothetical protein